jgi:hypothetical protein
MPNGFFVEPDGVAKLPVEEHPPVNSDPFALAILFSSLVIPSPTFSGVISAVSTSETFLFFA